MAEFVVRRPGEPDRTFPLAKGPVVVGRGDECDLQILEVRSSRRHLRIEPHPTAMAPGRGGRRVWVAVDLESSNGTFVSEGVGEAGSEDRILRRGLVHGDVLRIGETTLEFRDPAPAGAAAATTSAAPLVVGSRLVVQAIHDQPTVRVGEVAQVAGAATQPTDPPEGFSSGSAEPTSDADAAAERAEAEQAEARRARRRGQKLLVRGGAFLVIGGVIVLAEHLLVGGVADKRALETREAEAYRSLVAEADLKFETLEGDYDQFRLKYPGSRRLPDLTAFVDARRAEDVERKKFESEFETIQLALGNMLESEARARLTGLKLRRPGDEKFVRWVDFALADLDRRRDELAARDYAAAAAEADRLVGRGDAAAALRRLQAFRAQHPDGALSRETRERAVAKQGEVRAAAVGLADAALEKARKAADPDERRALLASALKGLAGTTEEDRLRTALRSPSAGGAAIGTPSGAPSATPGTAPTAPPTGPSGLSLAPELLAQVSEAERLSRERAWTAAAEAYAKLLAGQAPPRLKQEWTERSDELRRILSLVADLGQAAAAAGDKPLHVRTEAGSLDVLGADASGVRVRRKDGTDDVRPWASLSSVDTLALLSRPRPTPDQRLAMAVLAADLGDRKATVEHLAALVEVESHRALAFQVAARRLYGRAAPPEGGYLVFEGELVDRAEHARRLEAKRIVALKAEAAQVAVKIAADASFKKLDGLREKRAELDKRRAYALLAIFDEKHYPYPYRPPEAPAAVLSAYPVVQAEIDRRIASVEEVWNDPLKVDVSKGKEAAKLVQRHAEVLKELEGKGQDVSELRKTVQPYAMYADAGPLSVQTFFYDAEERELLRYNRWVMEAYNATPLLGPRETPPYASEPEREQTRITNAYRVMMGYTMRVEPGPAPLEAIESATVAGILDQSKELGRTALRAVRIDERLVKSSRLHSLDMQKHGYFAHVAPANSDEPGSTPFDRMAKQGYSGGGASENIAGGQSSPLGAHMAWRHSSGHHRNILSDWSDMGAGQAGNLWTQNFGGQTGGPMPPSTTAPAGTETPKDD